MDRFWLALAAWIAGILVALLGWLDAGEPFNARKFSASVIRALLAGILWAGTYDISEKLTFTTILGAIASGPFIDKAINLVGGLLGNPQFPLPADKNTLTPPTAPNGGATP